MSKASRSVHRGTTLKEERCRARKGLPSRFTKGPPPKSQAKARPADVDKTEMGKAH